MHITSNSSDLCRLAGLALAIAACVVLTGCPSASTPTQESGSGSPSLPGGSAGSPAGSPSGMPGEMPGGMPDSSPGGSSSSSPSGSPKGSPDGANASSNAGEPGFEPNADGGQGLPDLSDNPTSSPSSRPSTGSTASSPTASQSSGGASSEGYDQPSGAFPGQGGGVEGAPGQGPLTRAEQVAILDAELERSTGDFDDLIRDEQAEQRQREREQPRQPSPEAEDASSGTFPVGTAPSSGGYDGPIAAGGSTGGPPADPAKYPPPEDIPSGGDDDVVARQLREAAMREPDAAVRERLWDEYRKYKGISL